MFWNTYVLSCYDCITEYTTKSKKKLRSFGRTCPQCGWPLSFVPLARYTLSPPPEMVRTVREVKRVAI